jgi:quaternary ammonium compound-resistance protein SugE
MPWIVLLASAVLEAVWATALGASNGFSELVPSIVFGIALVLSMLGLGYAARHIPISTAYAIWTGTGAALTVAWGMLTGAEAVTLLRVVFLAGILCCVVGLKLVKAKPAAKSAPAALHFSLGEKRPFAADSDG